MEQRVKFNSDGEHVVGTLFSAEGAVGPLPTVVMAGGWCYTKEIVLPHVARVLADRGVQVLAFDYRGFGESAGERRQHLDPWMQIRDYQNALTYLESRDDVDADRLGAFGISYSGGHVLVLAAIDPRVRSVVSVVPVIDGFRNMRRVHGEARFAELQRVVLNDLRARAGGTAGAIPMSSPTPHTELSTWPFPRIGEVFGQIRENEAPRHEHWSTVESVELLLRHSVDPYLPRITNTGVLMLVAEGDNITLWDEEIDAFHAIPSPTKQLEVMPAVSHMSLYSDQPDTNLAAGHTAAWFEAQLGAARPQPAGHGA
ncbi:MAG: alpha/beta hydrolase [Baekduiaceae bacterium]